MSEAAKKPELEKLHDELAKLMTKIIREGETAVDKETGEAVRTTPCAAMIGQMRQFLKDNGVECAPGFPSKPVKELAESVPFPQHPGGDDDDDPALRKAH